MPYLLVAAALLITIRGVVTLNASREPQGVPWASLVIWAALFGGGLAAWLTCARG